MLLRYLILADLLNSLGRVDYFTSIPYPVKIQFRGLRSMGHAISKYVRPTHLTNI